jgi:hypothetical protein
MSVFSVDSVAINKGWSQTGLGLRSPTSGNPADTAMPDFPLFSQTCAPM